MIKKLFGLILTLALCVACQSDKFYIKGKTQGLNSGDSIIVSYDLKYGTPIDIIIVNNNQFRYQQTVDSVQMAILYVKQNPEKNVIFFTEPGIIHILLSDISFKSRVSGTPLNDDWQYYTDSIDSYSRRINALLEDSPIVKDKHHDAESTRKNVEYWYEKIERCYNEVYERNVNNSLGKYLQHIDISEIK